MNLENWWKFEEIDLIEVFLRGGRRRWPKQCIHL
jgi:hypothetical protein